MSIANVKEQTETITIPMNAEVKSTMIKIGEGAPPFVSLYAQAVGLIDVADKIPKYDHLSLEELIDQNRAEVAELWLKEIEYSVYKMAVDQFGEVEFTADLNHVRKTLGLPLSPFVSGGANRASSMKTVEAQNEKPTLVSTKDISIFEELGFTPSTIHTFYTNDLIRFYKEKTAGKGENTVRKYKVSVFDIREALETSTYTSWSEVDEAFWQKLIVFDFLDINGPVSRSHVKDFLSTIKLFTKWLDKHKKTTVAKDVAALISEVEHELIGGVELNQLFHPYYRYSREVHEKMAELAKILQNVDKGYQETTEGTFQVEKKNKGSIRLQQLDAPTKTITIKLSDRELRVVQEGMILIAEIGIRNQTSYELIDIIEVYPSKARIYF